MILRERLDVETQHSKSDDGWANKEIGEFVVWCMERSLIREPAEFYSDALNKAYPKDADLAALFAQWAIERGE